MLLRHHLAKGFNNIPIKNIRFATEHTSKGGQVEHTGWKIVGEYGGENPRSAKHKYEVIFNPAEAREFRDSLDKLLARFEGDEVQTLVHGEAEVADVEEEE